MTPQKLIEGLRYLAEQAPIEAELFHVPNSPSVTDRRMRIAVSPRDVLDLLDYIQKADDFNRVAYYENPA
jgi:hypothetical protein